MKSRDDSGQKGIILVQVLMLLTLFGIVGVAFSFYAADVMCERNPNAEMREGTCTITIGNTADRKP
jgi:hypothetical protein